MSCGAKSIQVDETKVFKAVRRKVGTNDALYFSYYSVVINDAGNDFSDEFKDYYKSLHPTAKEVTLDNSNTTEVVNAIQKFYIRNYPDGNATVIEQQDDVAEGYTNVADRIFCQRIVASEILDIFRDKVYAKYDTTAKSRDWYIDKARASFGKHTAEKVVKLRGLDSNNLAGIYNKQRLLNAINGYVRLGESVQIAKQLGLYQEIINLYEESLGNDISEQDRNYIATFREMINSTRRETNNRKISDLFFDTVFKDNRLNGVLDAIDTTVDAAEEAAQMNELLETGEDASIDDTEVQDFFDLTFRAYSSHDGQYTTFMLHVGTNIKTYLNSLRKLVDTGTVDGKPNYDTSNAIGIPDTMNASECAVMLYTRVNYANIDTMIESIRRISRTVAGFESFSQLATDLEKDTDFAYELYTTFGKLVIGKTEVVLDGDKVRLRASNRQANQLDSLRYQLEAEGNTSLVSIDSSFARGEYNKLEELFKQLKQLSVGKSKAVVKQYLIKRSEVIDELTTQIKRYHPSIDKSAIINYVKSEATNDVVDEVKNIEYLKKILDDIINASEETKLAYISKLAESASLRHEGKDTSVVWETPYMTATSRNAIGSLASALVNYSVVKTELNSTNVHGKKASDVINSSMITNFMNMLQSDLNNTNSDSSPIRNYAAYKFRGKQYELSNILVEKRDANNQVINYGLFRLVNGEYVPTKYATQLIRMNLFNGVNDLNTDNAILYAEMSKGDYIATAMASYFRCDYSIYGRSDIEFADYFMRTPADAPKNFKITAPRYRLGDNFFVLDDEAAVNRRVNEIIRALPRVQNDDEVLSLNSQAITSDEFVKLLIGNTLQRVIVDRKSALVQPDKNDATGYLTVSNGQDTIVIKGTIGTNVTNHTTELSNVTLYGVYDIISNGDNAKATRVRLKNEIIKGNILLSDGTKATRHINREHPVYKQLYAAFEQEMIDAATAIDTMFEHNNGAIVLKDDNSGEPKFSEYLSTGNAERKVFANYHTNGSEYVDDDGTKHKDSGIVQNRWEKVNGKWVKITTKRLSGKVFTSDKFTVTDRTTGETRNYLNEVLDESVPTSEDGKIHFLYGAATNTYLHINNDGSVTFTPAQQATINEALDNFIIDYINSYVERISNFEHLLTNIPHSYNDIAEFALNSRIAYFNTSDLFEGNTKFYKSAQDLFKRVKEVQGSGVAYAITDFTKPMFGQDKVLVEHSYLNSDEMQAIVGGLHDCKQYTTFRAATIKNTVRDLNPKTKAELEKQLTANFVKEGFAKNEAIAKAQEMVKAYERIKTNDAQSYITFEEWIKRVAAKGQLHKYKPIIEAILDESKPIDAKTLNQFIQVQKNFYYDQYYYEDLGVMAPRQIKNAEFVLVPRLIRGTELEAIYNKMIDYGIDQLNTEETSKAGKVNVLTLWDNEGNLTKEWTDDFNQNIDKAIELFDYNYLYSQQETPQHIHSENKAGIQIMKKILDNIPEDSPLYEVKKDLIEQYSYNIYDSFRNIAIELGAELDENGNLKLEADGTIKGINYEQLYKRLEEEMLRLGLDSNMLDYCTLDEYSPEENTGDNGIGARPRMPAHFSNVKTKLENISQSLFNHRITRQKLPGFHAAQITSIGWKNTGSNSYVYSKDLQYHPDGKRYVEVMLPAANFGFDINDPKYDNFREDAIAKGWSAEELENKIKENMLAELQTKHLDTLIGYRIPTEGKQSVCVMKVVGFTSDALGSTIVVPDGWVAQTGSDFDIDSIYGIQYATYRTRDGIVKAEYSTDVNKNYVNYVISNLDSAAAKELRRKARIDSAEARAIASENPDESYLEYTDRLDKEAKANLFFYAKQYAKEYNLMSFDEFSKLNFSAQNSRDARNNKILDDMIEILMSDEALEENLGTSNFRDIIAARDKILKGSIIEKIKEGRSSYDFLDQADNQEDATSGLKLKGASVARDNLCSVCNTAKARLTAPITIVYRADKNKIKQLKKSFDRVEDLGNGYVAVSHNTFGWSKNNRNVDGKLITAYSSQTTAHILDAIKEGNIPNVNTFTFNVYKLFPDIGSNYETAVAFMMQPGVTEIVNAHNRGNSVYISEYQKPMDLAIRSIADKIGIKKTDTRSIEDIEKEIKSRFGNVTDVLNADILIDRIRKGNNDVTAQDLFFDYCVIKQYQSLSTIASKVSDVARVCNPDKFGAKPSIFATRKVFKDIKNILNDDKPAFYVLKNGDRQSFLDAIYPDVGKGIDDYIRSSRTDSVYPPLHHFLKYASATSIKLNSNLFATQSDNFIKLVERITSAFSATTTELTEDLYNDFERYLLSTIYNFVPVISNPVAYTSANGFEETDGDIEQERRRIFGYGYPATDEVQYADGTREEFVPSDINNPSQEDIDKFALLTPAQKVLWIQQHFSNGLICNHIAVRLFNGTSYNKEKAGSQTIEFVEDGQDMNFIYEEFRKTFQNDNPFLAMTAMDIVKYGFVVEGFKMRKRSVNKVIDNDILINDLGKLGTGIVSAVDTVMTSIASNPSHEIEISDIVLAPDAIVENYVRSHPNMREIAHTYIRRAENKTMAMATNAEGIIAFDSNNDDTREFLLKHNIGVSVRDENDSPIFVENPYILIKGIREVVTEREDGSQKRTFEPYETLYKVVRGEKTDSVYLYPLSKLQTNEIGYVSVNADNNKGVKYTPDFYEQLIKSYEDTASNLDIVAFKKYSREIAQKAEDEEKVKQATVKKTNVRATAFDINDESSGALSALKQQIINHFGINNFSTLYVENSALDRLIPSVGVNYGYDKVYINGRRYIVYRIDPSSTYVYTKHLTYKIPAKLQHLAPFIERARERGISTGHEGEVHIKSLFAIQPFIGNEDTRSSSVTESIARNTINAARSINRTAGSQTDEYAERFKRQLNRRGITSANYDKTVSDNLKDVVISTAEYVTSKVDSLLNGENGLNFFTKVPGTEEYISIYDPQTIELIANNPRLRRMFLKTLLEAQNVIKTFSDFAKTTVTDDNGDLEIYLNKINATIDKLEKSGILEKAQAAYVNGYLANITGNPNIRRDIISLTDNFHQTGYLTSYISDLQDIANPIVQLITSDIMADIRAKEYQAKDAVKAYRTFIKNITDEAKRHGMNLDWDKIIDKNGRFINDYSEKFIEELDALVTAKSEAYEAFKNATLPVEEYIAFEDYLRKQLAYNKFVLEHSNQEIQDEYIRQQLEADEYMLSHHKDVFVEYKMLSNKLYDVLSHTVNGKLDAHWEEERKRIMTDMANLRSQVIILPGGFYEMKEDITDEELSNDPVKRRQQIINSLVSANAINKYVTDRAQLNDEIYQYTDKFGFKEELEKRLQIIRSREVRNEFGKLMVPEATLLNDKAYVEAKEWLRENATFKYGIWDITQEDKDKLLKPDNILISIYDTPDAVSASFNLRVQAALNFFKNSVGERGNRKAAYKLLAKKVDARDELGVIDGRKFNAEEIAIIKKEQEAKYNIGESNPYNEKGIIHNSPEDDTIYTSAFYKGLNVGGVTNPQYLAIVKTINSYLRRALDSSTGRLNTSELSIEEINAVLDELAKLGYDRTEQTFDANGAVKKHKGVKKRDVEAVKEFIKNNVDFVTDDVNFEIERAKAKLKGDRYYLAWQELNQEWSEEKSMFVPNHLLWGYAKPKDSLSAEEKEKFIDKAKTSAVRILNEVFEERVTKYYTAAIEEIVGTYGENSEEYKTWFENNHVYNPYKHQYEPLVCWTTSEVTDAMPGEWEANYGMKERSIKEEAKNENYKPKAGIAANYKKGTGYDLESDKTLNTYETQLKDYLQSLMANLARTKQASDRVTRGYAPAKAKKEEMSVGKRVLKELAQSVGWIEGHNGRERYNKDVSYGYDYTPVMPMMSQLKSKESIDLDKYERDYKPIRQPGESDADFAARNKAYETNLEAAKEKNRKIHQDMLDRNWEAVFEEYILESSHYNAIQDNKYQLYYGQKLLDDYMPYQTSGITGNIKERDGEYIKSPDNNLKEVYNNWIRRLVFDQWKKQQGAATRIMQILQSITSTNYMTLNLRGGIANVLVGETGIFGEAFAREYFGASHWGAGKALWAEGLIDYTANAYSEKSSTLSGAIVKGFQVVDFDERTGQVRHLDADELSKRLRDITFVTLSGGEHFMQNGALFSMMLSHRVVRNPRAGEPGQMDYVIMNEAEYLRYAADEALAKVATEEEIQAFKSSIKEDANVAKDYATFKKDLITEYVYMNLPVGKQKQYKQELDTIKKRKAEEFATCPTMHDQFKLGEDGTLAFKEGSILASLNALSENQEVNDAYRLMGMFKSRVISVNKKIHGFYDKMGAALVEREWWGSIVMQYHKHIYPGIMKRYRRKGYYNEERGTIEKGTFWSLVDFLNMPIRKIAAENKLNDAQTETMIGVQNYLRYAIDYVNYATLAWNVLRDDEKANIRRGLQDIVGMVSALLIAMGIRMAWDDDDDSIIYNLALYEADRLATETGMYSIGLPTEFRTLWSSPVAVQSIVSDLYNSIGLVAQMAIEGDDFDPYYRSGRYAGKKKLNVRLERRIPYWRNWLAIRDIADNNHYYRIGDNVLSFIPVKKWANKLKGKE